MSECHCGKDGHALNSINCPVHGWENDLDGLLAEIERLRAALGECRKMVGHPDNLAFIDAALSDEQETRDGGNG